MLEKSLMVGVALNSAFIAPPTQEEIINRVSAHFNEEINEIIIRDIYDIASDAHSLKGFVGVSCRVDQVLESSFKGSDIKTTAYFCEDEYQGPFNYNVAEVFSGDYHMGNGEMCRDLKMFLSYEEGKYDFGQSAYINKINPEGGYEQDYFYPNANCDDVINNGIPYSN